MNTMSHSSRILGGLYGSLVGDALGVPVEFQPRSERQRDPVIDLRAYGTHGQPKGTWSDDGALLLCSLESLVEMGFDPQDMGERFVRWSERGLWAAHGTVFDIGIATSAALRRIRQGTPAEKAGGAGQYDNGNGSLMRILPVVLAGLAEPTERLAEQLQRASAITHRHPRSQMACVLFGLVVRRLTQDQSPLDALQSARASFEVLFGNHPELSTFRDLLSADLASWPETEIRSSGYVMDTLTASLWCLLTTASFAECVLKAVNLGDDTDTTGCVAGGLAGVYYGVEAIPPAWLASLPRQEDLRSLFVGFLGRDQSRSP